MNRMAEGVVVVAAFALATLAAPDARAQGAAAGPSVEEQIKKLEADRAASVVKGDASVVDSTTSDDYTFINLAGQLAGKAQTVDAIKSGAIKLTANEVSDMKVRLYGDTAVVTGKSTAKGTINGREIKGPVMFTRVYVKKGGKWQSVAFQQTPVVP